MSPTAGSAAAYNRRVIPAVCACQCTVPCQCVQVPDRLRSAQVFTCLPFAAGSPWPLSPGPFLPTLTKSQWPGASLVPIKGIGKLPRKKRPELIIQCRPHRSDDNPLIYNTATKDHYIAVVTRDFFFFFFFLSLSLLFIRYHCFCFLFQY